MNDPFDLETAEYEFVISPSVLDASHLKPPSSMVRVEFGAVSHPGKVRNKNEDHFLISKLSRRQQILVTNVPQDQFPEHVGEDGYSMIVADGMGGMAAGEVASQMAIATGVKLFQKSPKWGFKINKREARDLFDRVNSYLREIDLALTQRSEEDRRLFGMGTTLTASYSIGVDLFVIHVGDSRLSLSRRQARAADQRSYSRPGNGRCRLYRSRRRSTPQQAKCPDQLPGRSPRQGQSRRPLASTQGSRPSAPLQRRLE